MMEKPDLHMIGNALTALAVAVISDFADEHGDEYFAAFGLDFHAEDGNVLLCLATSASHAPAGAGSRQRSLGQWKYPGFNLDIPKWQAGWSKHEEAISQYMQFCCDESEDQLFRFVDELMTCFCRALVRVEASGVLERLNKTPGFFTQTGEYYDDEQPTELRLQKIRKTFLP